MIKQNPFSIYDFFGYLIPGMVFIYFVYIAYNISDLISNFELTCSKIICVDINNIFLLLLISYIVGHILSFLSSITVERFSLWTLGYPSKYLLNLAMENGIFKINENKLGRYVFQGLTVLIIFPIYIFDLIFGKTLGMNRIVAKSLDKHSSDLILLQIASTLNEKFKPKHEFFNSEEKDWFRFIYHYVVENSPSHLPKMQNYVALFGFTRTLSLVFSLMFWIIIYVGFFEFIMFKIMIIALLTTSLLAYILYLDFNKFYRKFNLEAIMAYTVVTVSERKNIG